MTDHLITVLKTFLMIGKVVRKMEVCYDKVQISLKLQNVKVQIRLLMRSLET